MFLTRNPTLATPTPSGGNYIFPKTVTEEQESYVKGFEVALKNLQQHQIPEQTITGSHVGKFDLLTKPAEQCPQTLPPL